MDPTQPLKLAALERWLQAVVAHPGGALEGAHSDEATTTQLGGIAEVIEPSSKQTSLERVNVYAHGYWSRLLDCLREDFPMLRAALGDEMFDAFAVGYLQSYPSQSYTLGKLGARFPQYLEETSPQSSEADAWLVPIIELAVLERAINDIFDAPGGETLGYLTPEDLAAIEPQQRAEMRLAPLPTFRLLRFRCELDDYFSALRGASEPSAVPLPDLGDTYLALSRREFVVRRHGLSHAQYELLTSLAAG
ncbi:MAG: DNA-binding domain-containing protein, partial [Planctomycetia bacterium]|nr:DNA-binding domain-containing protein [Planctomycetia bacterium]